MNIQWHKLIPHVAATAIATLSITTFTTQPASALKFHPDQYPDIIWDPPFIPLPNPIFDPLPAPIWYPREDTFTQEDKDWILNRASQDLGIPVDQLEVAVAEPVTWPDGCRGVYRPNILCTMALVPGWRVVITNQQEQWVYHDGILNPNPSDLIHLGYRNPACFDVIFRFPQLFESKCTLSGGSQENPILPDLTEPGRWDFGWVPSGRWYDPPLASGFQYEMTSNSLFTEILGFPTGVDGDGIFSVTVGELELGLFSIHDRVNFVDLLGSGVSSFSITGIDPLVETNDPSLAFPIWLKFDTPAAKFSMTALTEPETSEVPEPSFLIGLIGLAAISLRKLKD